MSGVRVVNPGLFTSVQDRGRIASRDKGVPTSGVLDADALCLANAVVGNDRGAAVLECLGMGPELEAVDGPVRVAFIGEAPDAAVLRSDGGRQALAAGQSATLIPGDRLAVGALRTFCLSIAVEGGIDVPLVLGSRATYARGGFGGYSGRTLRQGDVVPVGASATARAERRLTMDWRRPDDPIRVVLGPQDDAFTPDGIATFVGQAYTVTNAADRMGFRFEGPVIAHVTGADIVSDGAVDGSIQVPGAGNPIVLLADGQSVGGYTKIATVISADLPRLVRRRPGDAVRFAAVSQSEGETIARDHDAWLKAVIASIEPFVEGLDVQALYDRNLISGVIGED